ncbi:MAG TPA: hypothetical protein PK747_00225 [Acidobacteriota bacterium]|nr:hypothetical protein [Acidobacteriota bacterium]HQQ45819.1 hypothetical protein [Acidobacteriota bacterium]
MRRPYLYILLSLIVCLWTFSAQAGACASRSISFEQRVQAQAAIERVYDRHRLWPAENREPKPPFEQSFPDSVIRGKVAAYIKRSAALKLFWNRTITGAELQEELDRMVASSKDPATLRELFSALGDDPFVIAECLVRPILADKLISGLYYGDKVLHEATLAGAGYPRIMTYSGELSCERIIFVNDGSSQNLPDEYPPPVNIDESIFAQMASGLPREGCVSEPIDMEDRFVVLRTLGESSASIEIEAVSLYKRPLEEWLGEMPEEAFLEQLFQASEYSYRMPRPTAELLDCVPSEGYWSEISGETGAPAGRQLHTAVWTGAEMIIWGGVNTTSLRTGGRYFPATDSWLPTSTGANVPSARYYHSAVWTGAEMIVWGSGSNTGGRYNPSSNTWSATSQGAGCPSSRTMHTAAWTGTEMIIWGGSYGSTKHNSGGRYIPSTNSWTATSEGENVPSARSQHTTVWTGAEMIVWGGRTSETTPFFTSTGGRYSPSSDTWTSTTNNNAPEQRAYHSAVWSGEMMIIWGGIEATGNFRLFSGSRYTPSSDSWMPTPCDDYFPEARSEHTSSWDGERMIVWGGRGAVGTLNSGAFYDPSAGNWLATSTGSGVPAARSQHTAVWTGEMMLVWGGYSSQNTGGIFFGGPAAPLFPVNNSAADQGCSDTGVTVSWATPRLWGDSGAGTRSFEVLREGMVIVSGLAETTLSYTDATGENEVPYLYQVRAVNGCGLSSLTAGVSAVDHQEALPDEVAFLDMTDYTWDAVAESTSYRLYRGNLADLPNLKTSSPDGCSRYEGPLTACADCGGDDPLAASGKLLWYLVTAILDKCEGSAGQGTGFTRVLSSTGKCGEEP